MFGKLSGGGRRCQAFFNAIIFTATAVVHVHLHPVLVGVPRKSCHSRVPVVWVGSAGAAGWAGVTWGQFARGQRLSLCFEQGDLEEVSVSRTPFHTAGMNCDRHL